VATEKASLDERKGATLDEMSGLVHQLTMKISERKARLAPIIKVQYIQKSTRSRHSQDTEVFSLLSLRYRTKLEGTSMYRIKAAPAIKALVIVVQKYKLAPVITVQSKLQLAPFITVQKVNSKLTPVIMILK
jgi:hypothetical protein